MLFMSFGSPLRETRQSTREQPTPHRRKRHDQHRRLPAMDQQAESAQSKAEIGARMNGAGPHRVVQRGCQHTHHGSVHAGHCTLHAVALAQRFPERQCAGHHQKSRNKDGDEKRQAAGPPTEGAGHHRAEVCGESEQGAGYGLRSSVSGEEGIVGDQPMGHDARLQKRQHHVPPPNTRAPDW